MSKQPYSHLLACTVADRRIHERVGAICDEHLGALLGRSTKEVVDMSVGRRHAQRYAQRCLEAIMAGRDSAPKLTAAQAAQNFPAEFLEEIYATVRWVVLDEVRAIRSALAAFEASHPMRHELNLPAGLDQRPAGDAPALTALFGAES